MQAVLCAFSCAGFSGWTTVSATYTTLAGVSPAPETRPVSALGAEMCALGDGGVTSGLLSLVHHTVEPPPTTVEQT